MKILLRFDRTQIDAIGARSLIAGLVFTSHARNQKVFGDYAHKVSISSTKSMTGHMLGGAGAVEIATCSLAIRDSVIPPTINLENPRRGNRP